MKRRLFSLLTAALLLLPAITTAASPGFTCDNCDYQSSAAGQREVTVAKDGGTVRVMEYFCPSCGAVTGSVEIPGSWQNSPAEDPEENKPSPSSNEAQEPDPPKPAEDIPAGGPALPSGAGSSSAVVIPVSPAGNDDTPKNPASSSGTQTAPAAVNVQPEQPAAGAGASVIVVPEQPAASAGTTGAVIVYPGSAGAGDAPAVVSPEQPVTNTGTADAVTAGSDNSAVIVSPEQPVTNAGTDNTGIRPPDTGAPIVLVPLDPSPASGVPSGTSPIGILPEQPVTSRDDSKQPEQQPATQENTQAVTYVETEPATEQEPVRVEPEYPVSPNTYQQPSSSVPSEADVPVVLVTEKPPVSAEIRDDPAFTPPPTAAPTATLKPNPSRTAPPASADDKYPVFSRFFPARRLHLKGDPEARAPRAGVKIWPEEPGMSLLNRMLNGGE